MRLHREEARATSILTVGLPNVGKTALMNMCKAAGFYNASSESNKYVRIQHKMDKHIHQHKPGSTTALQEKVRVSSTPIVYITDSPGIFHRRYPSPEVINKLGMAGIISETRTGVIQRADYILFELNRQRNFQYVNALDLREPCDDIQTILNLIGIQNKLSNKTDVMTGLGRRKIRAIDYFNAAQMFISAFEKGLFGKLFWDQDKLDNEYLAVQGTMLRYEVSDFSDFGKKLNLGEKMKNGSGSGPDFEVRVDDSVNLEGDDGLSKEYVLDLPDK